MPAGEPAHVIIASRPVSRLCVIAAGGTGGHVFPAEALAAELEQRGVPLALITDSRGGGYGETLGRIPVHRISAGQVTGQGLAGRLAGLFRLGLGFLQARRLLRRLRPGVAIGFGGYAAFPTALAASRCGIPTVIHEQNAVAGRANRMLAGRVRYIATAFERILGIDDRARERCVLVGNPVRGPIVALADRSWEPPRPDGLLSVLVTGGSQGASIFAEVVPAAVALLPRELRARLDICQQCRPEDLDAVRAAWAAIGMTPVLDSFFDDMPERLAAAHLLVCRAGASTISENTTAGRPAIYVPYPWATDDHQTANARAVAEAGGGWLMPQPEFTAEALAARLGELLDNPAILGQAAARSRALGHPNAARKLADLVASLMPDGPGGNGRTAA